MMEKKAKDKEANNRKTGEGRQTISGIAVGYAACAAQPCAADRDTAGKEAAPQERARTGKSAAPQENVRAGKSAAPQEISGDAAISCGLPDGSRALLLSDGMGKGARAAAESSLVVEQLRKLLKQGVPVASAVKTVNSLLLDKDFGYGRGERKESFATIDLAIVDPARGRVRFYKMGAAPSYVVRGRQVRRIMQPALPVGIMPTLKLSHVIARLAPGDLLVMVSDGIVDAVRPEEETDLPKNGRQQEDWLLRLLREELPVRGPRQLAHYILAEARKRCGGREQDDATVIVAVIR